MKVGFASSSRNLVLSIKKNLILILAMSLLYAIASFAIGEIKLIPNTEGGGELRPFIFIPALAAIIFGPAVGSFSAGIGNFLIDIVNDRIIQGDILDLGNLAGFIGNFVGAAVVGFLSWRLNFTKNDRIIFSGKVWLRYLQNTLAAVVGMGLVTGEIIGLLRVAFGKSSWEIGNSISSSIFYSNSLFLLISIIPLMILIGFAEKIQAKRYEKALHNSKNVTVLESPKNPHAIIENFEIIPSSDINGLVKGEWSQIKMVIRNNSTNTLSFRLEVNCEDRIDPSVAYTKALAPQETDEKYFQINPFNDSNRIFTIYIKNWFPTFKELAETSQIGLSVRYRYTYTALTPFEHKFNLFTKFLTVSTFAIVIFNTIRVIFSEYDASYWESSKYFIGALIFCGVEAILVAGWYIFKYITVKRKIEKALITAQEEKQKALEKQELDLRKYQEKLAEISDHYDIQVSPLPEISQPLPIETTTDETETLIESQAEERIPLQETVDSSNLERVLDWGDKEEIDSTSEPSEHIIENLATAETREDYQSVTEELEKQEHQITEETLEEINEEYTEFNDTSEGTSTEIKSEESDIDKEENEE